MRLILLILISSVMATGCKRQSENESRNPPEIVSRDSDTVFNEIPGKHHLGRNAYDLDLVETLINVRKRLVFVDQLRSSGQLDILKQEGTYTVFAPTDNAFPSNVSISSNDLRGYIIPGKIWKEDLANGSITTKSLNDEEVSIDLKNGKMIINNKITVIKENIGAGNGVIHEIDQLMSP